MITVVTNFKTCTPNQWAFFVDAKSMGIFWGALFAGGTLRAFLRKKCPCVHAIAGHRRMALPALYHLIALFMLYVN